MKKNEIYKIWKDLWINNNKIDKVLLKITDLSKSQLFLNEEIDDKYIEKVKLYFQRLNKGEPIEYVLNNAEFYSLDFYVDNRVLIPRNDTEVMVYEVLNEVKKLNSKELYLIDVWTWSSCIPISIFKNTNLFENAFVIDISKKALEISKINIKKYKLEKKIKQIEWNLLNYFLDFSNWNINFEKNTIYNMVNKNIVITANLPYIKDNDFENMDKETIIYEPALALYWWKNTWFELYEKLIIQTINFKKKYNLKNLVLFIEIGFDQKDICEKYLDWLSLQYKIYKDNWLIDRCVKIFF